MDSQSGTAPPSARRRILYASLALSAALHALLLTTPPPGQTDPATDQDNASIEIVLQEPPSPAAASETGSVTTVNATTTEPTATLPDLLPVPDGAASLPAPQSPPPRNHTESDAGPAPQFSPVPIPQPSPSRPVPVDSRMVVQAPPDPPPRPEIEPTVQAALTDHIRSLLPELSASTAVREFTWEHEGRIYRARLQPPETPAPTRSQQRRLEIHTDGDGDRTLTTSVTLQRTAFSRFAKFVDHWDDNVWLSGDEVIGRFHSNSRIRVETSRRLRPTFHGPVTVAAHMPVTRRLRDPDLFPEGIHTGVARIPMPTIDLDEDAISRADADPQQDVRFFTSDATIEFLAGGGYRWNSDDGQGGRTPHSPIAYLIARDGVTLSVRGTVTGQILVYAPRRLLITGNLVYRESPDSNPASTDLLGLISDGSVLVAPPTVTGRGDLDIHAAIYAGRRFAVQRFRSRQGGTMTILGSLTAGSVSATEPRYRTRVIHDDRFSVLRPPLFPQTAAWTEEPLPQHWRIAGDGDDPFTPDSVRTAVPGTPPDAVDNAAPLPER